MTLQARFALWLGAVFLIFTGIVSYLVYQDSLRRERQHAYEAIGQIIASVDATQEYVRHVSRPWAFERLPKDDFAPEVMSTSFVARRVMDLFLADYPDYYFKFATNWAHNPTNLADESEQEVIDLFQDNPDMTEWRGTFRRDGKIYLVVATPLVYSKECMQCHGEPSQAPASLRQRYANGSGFHIPENSVAIKSIGVPLSMTFAAGMEDALTTMAPVLLVIAVVLYIALRLFNRFVTEPIGTLSQGAQRIARGNYDTQVDVKEGSEFKGLAAVFNSMARSIHFEIKRYALAEQQISKDFESQRAIASILDISLKPLTLQEKLQEILRIVLSVTWLPLKGKGAIFTYNTKRETLELMAHQGFSKSMLEQCQTVKKGQCICGEVAAERMPTFKAEHRSDKHPDEEPHSHYCLPIESNNVFLGVINVYTDAKHDEKADEIDFLESATRAIATVMEKSAAEEALRNSEERYALAAKGANDGLWDWDLSGDRIYLSIRCLRILGIDGTDVEWEPDRYFSRVYLDDQAALTAAIREHLEGETENFRCEFRIQREDESWCWVLMRGLAVRDKQGEPVRMVGSQTDITSRKQAEEQLAYNAYHDELTGLANRARFMDRVGYMIEHTKRHKTFEFAVLFLDIDRFKNINDSLGHMAGDLLLVMMAQRIEQAVRPSDLVARLGGDEFVVLLDELEGPEGAIRIADRIVDAMERSFMLDERELFVQASIGIAYGDNNYESPEELLRDADNAMYQAKADPGNHVRVFDSRMHVKAIRRLQLENDLRRAIERNEFEAYFQPIIAMSSKRILGFEALARWHHPDHGLVSPIDFIPVAEETGLIDRITAIIMTQACQQVQQWNETFHYDPPLYVSVNIAASQLLSGKLVSEVKSVLQFTQLPPEALRLEVTESMLMGHEEVVIQELTELKALGVGLYIDDFGTGYSSLSYMHRFPFDILKIDRSFVERIDSDGEGELVKTIFNMAGNFGMGVIAEGVETHNQASFLVDLTCDAFQGFLFSPPVSAEEMNHILETGKRLIEDSPN